MKRVLFSLFVLVAAPAVAQQSVPDISFDSTADFLKLPAGMNFGEVPGVAVNSKGHIFVFTRSNSAGGPAYAPSAAQLLEFDAKGELLGEIAHMAPERTRGTEGLDGRSDLYGLGATVYALLTGQLPLKGSSMIETLLKIRQEQPVSARRYQPAIPEALDAMVMKLLAKRREDRYQNAAALLRELEQLAKSVGEKT